MSDSQRHISSGSQLKGKTFGDTATRGIHETQEGGERYARFHRWRNAALRTYQAAAHYAGIGEDLMRAFVNSTVDPIPHIKSGKKKLIRVSAIAEYLEKKEER